SPHQGRVLGVPGPRLSGAPDGAARDRSAAHRGGMRSRPGCGRVHPLGAPPADAVALPGRNCVARAAALLRQRGDRGPAMRIALLSVSAELGGSETCLLELVRGLVAIRGMEPIVV